MGSRIAGITIEIGGDTTKLQSALKKTNQNIRTTQSELKDVNKLLKLDPKNVELLKQKQGLLTKATAEVSEKLRMEKEALSQLQAGPQTEETIKQQEALTREIIATSQHLESLEKEYKEFGSVGKQEADAVSAKMKEVGKSIEDTGSKISGVGDKMTAGISAPIAALGVGSAKMAMDFEDAMAKVSTIADTSQVPMDELRQQILDLSNETGIAAGDIADNVYNAISAGQDTANAVQFVGEAARLSTAGFADSASALDVLTTTLNAYGMEASKVTEVSDMLIQTQNMGKTTVGELAGYMGKVIPTAKSANVGLSQVTTAYAKLTANGIATADSTTYLNSMLNELNKSGTKVSDALKNETGKSFSELMAEGNSLADVLNILQTSADESGVAFSDMWSSAEAGKAANVIHDTTNKLGDFNAAVEQMEAAGGATGDAYSKMQTESYELNKTLNELKNTGIELGSEVLVAAQPLLDSLATGISSICTWFTSLDSEEQQQIIHIAAIAAAAGPVLSIGGRIVSGIGTLTQAGSGLVGTISSITGGFGSAASAAGSAVESVSSLGSAASTAAAPVSSAGGAVGTLSQNALGLVAAGAGILLAAAGMALLAQAAIGIAQAGPGAAVAMVGLVAAMAVMAVGAAALAPALTAGAVGLVAFGAGVALVGVGILAATSGMALLATQLPTIATHGGSAALAIGQISLAMAGMALAAGGCTIAFAALLLPMAGAALTIGAVDLALLGFSATIGLATVASAALGVAMLAVSEPVESIKDNAEAAGTALEDMVDSVDVIDAALEGLKDLVANAGEWLSGLFEKETPTASASAKKLAKGMTDAMTTGLNTGFIGINAGLATNMLRTNTVARTSMLLVEETFQSSLNRIKSMFANTQLSFNQNIKVPHFSLAGSFNAETGQVPTVNVSWYRKAYDEAYVLNGATIFGAMGGRLLGGGEGHGSEMVVGTEKLMNMIKMASGGGENFTLNLTVNSPTPLSPSETARQSKKAMQQVVRKMKGK